MKIYRAFLSCLLLLAMFLFSCEAYEPEGEYFKEIEVKEPEPLKIRINPATDTVFARGITHISFDVVDADHEYYGYMVFINEELLKGIPGFPDGFGFDSRLIPDGHYPLTVFVYLKSNTGSLADKLEREAFVIKYSWVLRIDNRTVKDYPFNQFTVTEEEGRVKLSWPEYDIPDFYSLSIYRCDNNLGWGGTKIAESFNPAISSYYDDAFVGGTFYYRLGISASNEPKQLYSSYVRFEGPFPQITKQEQKEEGFLVEWSACSYPNNFGAYEIYGHFLFGEEMIYRTENISDTTALLPASFGIEKYKLITKGKEGQEPMEWPISYFELQYGLPHEFGRIPHFLLTENAYLIAAEDGTFTKFDGAGMEPLISRQYSGAAGLTTSDNGRYIYCYQGSDLVRLSPESLEVEERIPVESLLGYRNQPWFLAVNNHNQLFFAADRADGSLDSLTLADMTSKQVLRRREGRDPLAGELANDAKFFAVSGNEGRVLALSEGDQTYPFNGDICLIPGSPSQLIYSSTNTLELMELEGLQRMWEFSIPSGLYNMSVDPLTGYVGGWQARGSRRYYMIYNIETGELLKEIEVSTDQVVLQNNTLFTADTYLPLSML